MTEFGELNTNIQLNITESSLPSSGVISGASDISLDSPNSDNLSSYKKKTKCFNNEFKVKKIVSKSRLDEKNTSKIHSNPLSDFENQIHSLNEHKYCSSSSENELGGTEKDDFHFKMNRIVSKKRLNKISKISIKDVNDECYESTSDDDNDKKIVNDCIPSMRNVGKNRKFRKQNLCENGIKFTSSKDNDNVTDTDSDKDPLDILRVLKKGAPLVKCNEEDL
ncbi:Hypothetical protein SRAE_X000132000 [Strongyloides ratti]|uniref:Uncharacterized protein n=1 Tax=Strongyloides ratti TaxID=34506 RepID=A0A090KPT6_STRRB|nr:Hypothetical protein SRAE_X000132000 [Strongyloides ratti]CEF59573.1 Hypothetical protein SRAE_X000132000 [Strongyloides ratti]